MKLISAPFRWFKKYFWKLTAVFLVALFAYGFYLDAQIKTRFDGNKWVVPAQLFARPLTLQQGQEINRDEILQELSLLGYRQVSQIRQPGEYTLQGGELRVFRRAFAFADGFESARQLRLKLQNDRLVSIYDNAVTSQVNEARLEPMMVTRIITQSREDRILLTLEDIPTSLIETLIMTEDRDFYHHHGVAPLAILRALVANIKAGRTVQGGSTLTQQLAKNLFLTRERSLIRKINEAIMAVIIDLRYSKDEIIETYLNEVFLGQRGDLAIHGFGLASYYYFNRPLEELNLAEQATLVGMVKGPSAYNPFRHPQNTRKRRDVVLRTLFEQDIIDKEMYTDAVESPLNAVDKGILSQHKYPAFMQQVNRELRQVLPAKDLRESGIKIFSTLDPHIQRAAEQATEKTLTALQSSRDTVALNAAIIASDFRTGGIRALVGGKEFDYQGFNRVLDARRPVGSLIKPAVYLTALEQPAVYTLATPIEDKPIRLKSSYGKYWEPQNVDKQFRGSVPLLTALSHSLNVPTVKLGMTLGLENVADTIERLGVKEKFDTYPAMTLGALNLSPRQVNQMYQTIANVGIRQELHSISAISTHDDIPIWYRMNVPEQRVDKAAAYLVNYALHKVTREGTGKRLKQVFPRVNFAGKTGTTDDYRDSWFSGMDNQLATTIWVGNDDNLETGLTGSAGAMSIFINMQRDIYPKSFNQAFPEGIGIAHFAPEDGSRKVPGCANGLSVPAYLPALPGATTCDGKPPQETKEKSLWESLFGS